ncbi:gliding motility-associated C-terminal domain-containing protein [Chitinophaga defluvii]|uniref:Gliding motility-associated C-terminal domain-containing protein n=1 Tax=Chitinophaga defluvii TaxID=3163343 RepID=A0ABV2T137_9BACT
MKFFPVRLFYIILYLIMIPLWSHGAVFIVTSNADSGPGTLREAIGLAAANGTTERDYIKFNLTGDITIKLNTNLPELTSNIVLDGSSQPGSTLGASGAKVFLLRQTGYLEVDYYGLKIAGANKVEIYGLLIRKPMTAYYGAAILITGSCTDIIIGAPGKGNVMNGYTYGIHQDANFPELITNISIQGNIIGWEEDGISTNKSGGTYRAILLPAIQNIKLGGSLPGEENTITSYSYGSDVYCYGGRVTVIGNIFGADIYGTGIQHYIAQPLPTLQIICKEQEASEKAIITDNLIAGNSQTAIVVSDFQKGVEILRNKIGTDITGKQLLGERQAGIHINNCGPSMIGGSIANKNIVAGCTYVAITVSQSYFVTISQNEMFCNNTYLLTDNVTISLGYDWETEVGRPRPFIEIKFCDANTISGITVPNAKIEVFTPYRCGNGKRCDGRNYIETIMADGEGKWSYALNGKEGAVFSATDEQGATSDYTSPQWTYKGMDVIEHTACGKSLGGIPTMVISGAVPFYWEDQAGNIVSRDTCLKNVPAGKYRMVMFGAGCNLPECAYKTYYFTIEEHNPVINTDNMDIRHATCGNKNGSIDGLYYEGDNLQFSWRNAAGIEVGTTRSLTDIGPGKYTITITDVIRDCKTSAGPFEVKNGRGPTLDVAKVILKDAICNKPTGSISGLRVTGSGELTYSWVNSSGDIVGNEVGLSKVPAGSYVLKFSDATSCGSAESDSFYIKSPGLIAIDKSKALVNVSDCGSNTGSVTGLKISNGETINWVDETGTEVSNTAMLAHAAPGQYTLIVTNTSGCTATENFEIVQAIPSKMTMVSATIQHPLCNGTNGQLKDVVITGGTPISWKWMTLDGEVISTGKELKNVAAGAYQLLITDAANCEQLVTTVTLKDPPLPGINTTQGIIEHDQCNLNLGAIGGITVSGVMPFTYQWFSNSQLTGTTLDLKGLHAGDYILKVRDNNGCEVASSPFVITNSDVSLISPRANDVTIVKGMTAEIKVNDPLQGMYALYNSSGIHIESSTNGIFKVPGLVSTTTFLLEYKQGTCVSDKSSVRVEVVDGIRIYVPTAFSPNGDGINDYFRIKAYGIAALDLFEVFDRWGNKVFFTRDLTSGWNGSWGGKRILAGSYVWQLKAVDVMGNPVQQQGVITVVY